MSTNVIIGIDVSKNTLDGFISSSGEFFKVENTPKGFLKLNRFIKRCRKSCSSLLVVFEHTGLYSYRLEKWLMQNNISYSMVSGLQIKRSMGIVRGKTDRLDALRITQYALSKKPAPTSPQSLITHRLKTLVNLRSRLVTQRAGYESSAKQMRLFLELKSDDVMIKVQQTLINSLARQIEKIEQEIKSLIDQMKEWKKNFELLNSIPGIGFVVAAHILAATDNFKRFTDPRKFACYCGTAPFEHASGISIRGKTRVSNLANKRIKSILNMAAIVSICHDPELKIYFNRRTSDGKSKMSTLNIIRNKIIYRMFAVIKRQSPYVKLGKYAA